MSVTTQAYAGGAFNATSIPEGTLRQQDVTLRLTLHDGARWSAAARGGALTGLRMSLSGAGVNLRLVRVAANGPTELMLYLEREKTLDVIRDTPLTLSIVHYCTSSVFIGTKLPACVDREAVTAAAASAASLTATLTVQSGGAPPTKPGAPWLRHLSSYSKLMLLWSPPDLPGSSRITGYTWVEFIAGRAVLTGDNIPLTFSDDGAGGGVNASEVAAELSGYSKGYGIIPGALAAVNDAGFSEYSASWEAATMGRPNSPRAVRLAIAEPEGDDESGGILAVSWACPTWNGGYPLTHYELTLQRYLGDATGAYEAVALTSSSTHDSIRVAAAHAVSPSGPRAAHLLPRFQSCWRIVPLWYHGRQLRGRYGPCRVDGPHGHL